MRPKFISTNFLFEAGGEAIKGLPKSWVHFLVGSQGSRGRDVGADSEIEAVNFPYTNNKFAAALKATDDDDMQEDNAAVIIRDGDKPIFMIAPAWEYKSKFHVFNQGGQATVDSWRSGGRRGRGQHKKVDSFNLKEIKEMISNYIGGQEIMAKRDPDINITLLKTDKKRAQKRTERRKTFSDLKKGDKLTPRGWSWDDKPGEDVDYAGREIEYPSQAQIERSTKLLDKKVEKIEKDVEKELDKIFDVLMKNKEHFYKEVLDDIKQGYDFQLNAKEFARHLFGETAYGKEGVGKIDVKELKKFSNIYSLLKNTKDPAKIAKILADAGYK